MGPYVVPLLEAFRAAGPGGEMYLHIVLEFLPDNLHEAIGGRPLPPHEVCGFGFQLLRALAHLDSMQICHRDVKPENFLVGPQVGQRSVRVLKRADFGTAKRVTSAASTSDAIEPVARLLMYDPAARIHPIKALMLPFYDKLTKETATIPANIFDFTDEELSVCDDEGKKKLLSFATARRDNLINSAR